jgi:predicted transcriptional regulator of viral defense system
MNMNDQARLGKWAEEFGGVFTLGDLRVLNGELSDAGVYKKVERLVAGGNLVKVKRGLYALSTASLASISARIDPEAYISTGTALSRYLLIGSVPARRLQAVKVGVPRKYSSPLGAIEHMSIAPRMFFGFTEERGIRMATPEKAWRTPATMPTRGGHFLLIWTPT